MRSSIRFLEFELNQCKEEFIKEFIHRLKIKKKEIES